MLRRALEILFIVFCVGLLAAPALQMALPFVEQTPLAGVVTEAERPALGLDVVANETFQRQFAAWFDQHFGFRPTATRLDNSLNYYVFRETRPEQPVKLGAHEQLFLNEQIWFHNRRDDPKDAIERFARNLRKAQDLLAARGKFLVVMLLPSKTSVYPEEVPRGWSLRLDAPRPCDAKVYGAFVRELERVGAAFVDGRALALREYPEDERDRVYSRTGRHLNAPPACRILEEALTLARPHVKGATILPLDCRYEMIAPESIEGEEFDLLRLANVWHATPDVRVPQMAFVPESVPVEQRPDTLVVGSSFAWRTVFEAERNHAFGRIHLFYYNKTVVDRDGRPFYPVPPVESPEWRSLVLDKKLYLLPTPEEYLAEHNGDFLADLVAALERE